MNTAVFVDFENLYKTIRERGEVSELKVRDTALAVLQGVVSKLRESGHAMLMGRSYAAFDSYPGSEVAHELALLGLDPQYVLVGHSGRDSADVQLTFDVARVLFRRSDIGLIVVVSGDRDFLPLARQVIEEGRELRLVSIFDATSGDLRARVGEDRFQDAMELAREHGAALEQEERVREPRPVEDEFERATASDLRREPPSDRAATRSAIEPTKSAPVPRDRQPSAVVVGRIPVTWANEVAPRSHQEQLEECLDLMIRSLLRHGSKEVWLSPFLKGPMSQHFAHVVHPERRAMINELRDLGVLRIEERENLYADHPYSVIVLDDEHAMVRSAWARVRQGGSETALESTDGY
ncbi:MAG: NYN domain-containing protein [Planctomycetota bacterium]